MKSRPDPLISDHIGSTKADHKYNEQCDSPIDSDVSFKETGKSFLKNISHNDTSSPLLPDQILSTDLCLIHFILRNTAVF